MKDRKAWHAAVHRVAESWHSLATEQQQTTINIFTVSLAAQMVKNLPAIQEAWVQSQGWEDAPEKGMTTHSSILASIIPWTEES